MNETAYRALAAVYDRFTEDVDYDGLFDYLQALIRRAGITPERVLDLACGTGSLALRFARAGCAVIGADASEEMLTVAADKLAVLPEPPLLIRQSMERLRLPEPVDLCVCTLDSLNYLTEPRAVRGAVSSVFRALRPGGLFLFDVRTPSLLRSLDGQVFLDEDDDACCIWRGSFEDGVLTYAMDIFTREGSLWRRSQEQHDERAWEPDWLEAELRQAGFSSVERFGNRTLTPPAEDEERIFFAARKDT